MGSFVQGVYVPSIGEVGWGTNVNDFLTRSGEEYINVKQSPYGAVGDGSHDDTTAIQAALTVARVAGGGTVIIPPGVFKITAALLVGDGVSLRGVSPTVSIIQAASSYASDSMIRCYRRDDNTPNNEDRIEVHHLRLVAPTSITVGSFWQLDITGVRNGEFSYLKLDGPGPATANYTAIRISDHNPANTSSKSTFFNVLTNIKADGTGWRRFLYYEQLDGNSNHLSVDGFNAFSRIGIEFGSNIGSSVATFTNGYLYGDNLDIGVKGGVPADTTFINVDTENHTGPDSILGRVHVNTSTILKNVHVGEWFIGDSGTAPGTPIGPGSGTPENFITGAYIKVPSGTVVAGGSNTYSYFFNSADAGYVDSFLIVPVSGLPNVPVSFQGTISGSTFTLKVVAQTGGVTLGADLILRVVNIGRSLVV